MTTEVDTKPTRKYRTLAERTAALKERIQKNESRLAMKELSRIEAGQKILRAMKQLATLSVMQGADPALRNAAGSAIDILAKALEKRYGILAEQLLPLEAQTDLPYEGGTEL